MLKLRPRDCLLFAGFMQLKEKAGGLKALAVAQTFSGACLQTVSYRQSQQGVIVVITIEEGHETAYRFEANGTHTFLVGENEPLPQQEKVTAGADDAPPVLAGDKGKYALGCKGGTDPARTYWPSGENGLKSNSRSFP